MTVVYPNGIIDIILWENGNVDKKKILTGFLKDGESETISLNPEKVLSDIIQQAKKTLSSNFDD